IRVAFGESWMPAPTSSNFLARSKSSTWNPCAAKASAAVSPAMPAPAMRMVRGWRLSIRPACPWSSCRSGRLVDIGASFGPRLAGPELRIVAIERGAIGTDLLIVVAHVDIDMRMIEGRIGAHAHEFPDPYVDGGVACAVLEM